MRPLYFFLASSLNSKTLSCVCGFYSMCVWGLYLPPESLIAPSLCSLPLSLFSSRLPPHFYSKRKEEERKKTCNEMVMERSKEKRRGQDLLKSSAGFNTPWSSSTRSGKYWTNTTLFLSLSVILVYTYFTWHYISILQTSAHLICTGFTFHFSTQKRNYTASSEKIVT